MRNTRGFTITELLIALAVIGVAFGALAYSQLTSMRASSRSQLTSNVKAEASRMLERKMAEVLVVIFGDDPDWQEQYEDDDVEGSTTQDRSFKYTDYYYTCRSDTLTAPRNLRPVSSDSDVQTNEILCASNGPVTLNDPSISIEWEVVAESGMLSEGAMLLTVTATHDAGPTLTLVSRITCYDVYPSPTSTVPEPCPIPAEGTAL